MKNSETELELSEYEQINASSIAPPPSYVQRYFGPGSLMGSTFTTLACVVGIGLLSLPYAVNLAGLCLGGLLLVLGMLTSYYTCNLLVQCSHLAGKPTYEEIGTVAYGKHMGSFVAANMIVNNYGTLVAYMVLIQELPPGALKLMGVESKVALSGIMWGGCITLLVVWPLSLARKVSVFRFSSVLSFCSSLFITCVIISQAFVLPNTSFSTHISNASLAKVPSTQPDLFNIALAIPLVVFAYTCQQNIPYIYKVMEM